MNIFPFKRKAKNEVSEIFEYAQDDSFAVEHQILSDWSDVVVEAGRPIYNYKKADLKNSPAGEAILQAKGEEARRLVAAAGRQLLFYEPKIAARREEREIGQGYYIVSNEKELRVLTDRKEPLQFVLYCLLSVKDLPLESEDLLLLMRWRDLARYPGHNDPELRICQAIAAYCASHELDDKFRTAAREFAKKRQNVYDKKTKQTANEILKKSVTGPGHIEEADYEIQSPPQPAMAGRIGVLEELKVPLGMAEPGGETEIIGPDEFPLSSRSPLKKEHEEIDALLNEMAITAGVGIEKKLENFTASQSLALWERSMHTSLLRLYANDTTLRIARSLLGYTQGVISWKSLQWSREDMFDLIIHQAGNLALSRSTYQADIPALCELVQQVEQESTLTEGERFVLSLLRAATIVDAPEGQLNEDQLQLTRLIRDKGYFFLSPHDSWGDFVNRQLADMLVEERAAWEELLRHCMSATSARPNKKWVTTATELVSRIGSEDVVQRLAAAFSLVGHGANRNVIGEWLRAGTARDDQMRERDADCLRGLLWITQCLDGPQELLHEIRNVAISCFRKLPGIGPRAPKVGNAAIYALSSIGTVDAVGQLAMLKVRVKSRSAQKEIEKAFLKSAEELGLAREDVEELGVPTYGLESVGLMEEQIGDYTARIEVDGSDATLSFCDANGKQLKSVPAKVKADFKEELQELRQSLKDIKGMLPAQRDRIDSMFLLEKSWPIAIWRERYLDHPLVGTIARRLIWSIDGTPAFFINGEPRDVTGAEIPHGQTAEITLWHPIHFPVDEVVAWRDRLEELAITQPFKQAFREIYPLTAAEQNTRTYSNRFAAHILRQHQFHALCQARGWKNKLRLMVDDDYPPAEKELSQWNLRAEFWVEGIGEGWGQDTNEAGSYLRLVTDQVRFYRLDAAGNRGHAGGGGYTSQAAGPGEDNFNEPLQLEEIPELVFSEVMRDVDLFVGVSSVGNDPTWQDGGPEGRYHEYWTSYAFGDLSQSARTRKDVLERLIPRLKIAPQCRLDDRFLYVQGTRHVYKIHLGSGNILMSPNDKYLCIVPDARARVSQDSLYLPFEGDGMLSIILSKAFLLAADDKIKDRTILHQL